MTIAKLALLAMSAVACYRMPETEGVSTETLLDMTDVDNLSFNDIEDAPGFVNPPDGVYDVLLIKAAKEKYKLKQDNPDTGEKAGTDKQRIRHTMEILGVVELSDANEQAPKVGDKFSEQWVVPGEGLKYWKGKTQAIIGSEIGNVTVNNVLKDLTDGQYRFRVKVTNRKSKAESGPNKGKEYNNINVKVVARAEEIPGFDNTGGASGGIATGGVAVD